MSYNILKYICGFAIATILINCTSKLPSDINGSSLDKKDEALLTRVQHETFDYFWKGGEEISGAAPERIHIDDIYPAHPKEIVTSGGTGFGIMALIVGIERGFVSREAAILRLTKLTNWLEQSDRHHGAWPHWLMPDGSTRPFSKYDDGGDLVETAFLAQGLLVARQYLLQGSSSEQALAKRIDALWRGIDWQWYTNDKNVLYWHWSPNYGWKMNFAVTGHNECLIMYVLAASSPTHPIDPSIFHQGYMRDGDIVTDKTYYGLPTVFDHYATDDKPVGPLFWSHYSHLGLDPRDLKDQYGDYWRLNQNHAQIHYRHCMKNPNNFKGYGPDNWGLTSSYSMKGYGTHSPSNDLGVISPTAALSSFPYTPKESMDFLRHIYADQDSLVGVYGPYDAFSLEHHWYVKRYLAIDQLTIPIMIENYRSGLIWDLFMSAPEIQQGLSVLGFTYRKLSTI